MFGTLLRNVLCSQTLTLAHLLSVLTQTHAVLLNEETLVPFTLFQLTCSHDRVVSHVTIDVSIRCALVDRSRSTLHSVTRIRLLRKSPITSKWELVAEQGDTKDPPTTRLDISISGKIDSNVVDTFLEVTWPMAVENTFGTYKCDVVGFEKTSLQIITEETPLLEVTQGEVNAADVFSIYEQTSSDLSNVNDKAEEVTDDVSSLHGNCAVLTKGFQLQLDQVANMSQGTDSVTEAVHAIRSKVIAAKQEALALATSTEGINHTISVASGQMEDLSGQVTSISEELNTLRVSADGVGGDISAIRAQTASLNEDLQSLLKTVESLSSNMTDIMGKLNSVEEESKLTTEEITSLKIELQSLTEEIISLDKDLDRISDQISILVLGLSGYKRPRETVDALHSWPQGEFALLRPTTGCPVDLTFTGQRITNYEIQTEFHNNGDSHPAVLGHWTKSKSVSKRFMGLWFCEANGLFSTDPWPLGSYCINKIDSVSCPLGFNEGGVYFDLVGNDIDRVRAYTSRSVDRHSWFLFCCRDDGNADEYITLPSTSPFLLYRRGGKCQSVKDMVVLEEMITFDTDNRYNSDRKRHAAPDVTISETDPLEMFICHYTNP